MKLPTIHTLDSLRAYPDYRYLWTANFCANTAQWLQLLTVGWLVKSLTENGSNSALLVVGIGGAAALPGIIIGPWGGVLGDRLNRKKLVISLEIFMVLLALSFALLLRTGFVLVWHVYAFVLLAGCCETLKMPIRQALIANTVPSHALSNAYATSVLTIPGTRMIGPFIGGIIVSNVGFFWNFTIEALLYLGVIVALIPMSTPYFIKREFVTNFGVSQMFTDMADGFKYLWKQQRPLSLIYMLSAAPNVVLHPVIFLLPLFTIDVLHRDVEYGGYMMAVNGAGGLLMVFVFSAFGFPKWRGMLCILSALGGAIMTLLLSQSLWITPAFLVLAIFGATQTAFRTTTGVLTQTLAEDQYRVRAMSAYRIGMGMVVFFSLFAGWMAGITSVRPTLLFMGALGVVISIIFWIFSPAVRNQD
ncbi:MAG TPA: MFS transporter [Dehalococcoidia bacterium]|jgi:MFS family permease|nr:MFS transporter [Dehalococcoidia bacterium]